MRRLLLSGMIFLILGGGRALAADFAPQAEPVELYNWTGFYLGVTGGWALDGDFDAQPKDIPWIDVHQRDLNGGMIGGTAGYNWQVPSLQAPSGLGVVLGVEVNGFATDINGDKEAAPLALFPFTFPTSSNVDTLVNAQGKVGLAFDRGLLYIAGGYAGAQVSNDASIKIPGLFSEHIFSDSGWQNGAVVSAGIDLAVADNWVAGIQFSHYQFDNLSFSDALGGGGGSLKEVCECQGGSPKIKVDSDLGFDTVVGRLQYHF
jgi:outer membrane immunogenic protein